MLNLVKWKQFSCISESLVAFLVKGKTIYKEGDLGFLC